MQQQTVNIFMDLNAFPVINKSDDTKMFVYMLYNVITNKAYIGKTKHTWHIREKTYNYDILNPNRKSLIIRSLRKYGWDAFKLFLLEGNVSDLVLLGQREKFYIHKYRTNIDGYNMTPGGDGGCSESARATNQRRMQAAVKDGSFILQRPDIKKKANKAASKRNKQLYAEGKSNLLNPALRQKAIQSCMHRCILTIIREQQIVFTKKYNSKKDILLDGFPQNIIRQLLIQSPYTINFTVKRRGPVKVYQKGDIISLELL
jgi:group I intron endonuclease